MAVDAPYNPVTIFKNFIFLCVSSLKDRFPCKAVHTFNLFEHRPFKEVRVDPFSFSLARVPCGDDRSSLSLSLPPRPRRLIGLSEGGFGSEGRVGLVGGGPGVASSMTWAHMFSSLTKHRQMQ